MRYKSPAGSAEEHPVEIRSGESVGAVTPSGSFSFHSATPSEFPKTFPVFSPEPDADIIPDDVAEYLAAPSALLDLKGVTAHRSYDEIEFERWERAQEISRKLCVGGMDDESRSLRECHSFWTVRRCCGCRKVEKFWNRCDKLFCPLCAPRLAKNRLDGLMWFIDRMTQPKHVVLTFKNVQKLDKAYVRQCLKAVQKLRRCKIARTWKAGLWAMEITNRGNGWHLHYHLLLESCWFSQEMLSATWKVITECQSFIVHVSDASRDGIMKKLPKYVAAYSTKGTQIEKWETSRLTEFVRAIQGTRTFGVFGDLYKKRTEWRAWILSVRRSRQVCECGCSSFQYFSELQWFLETEAARPPPRVKLIPHSPSEREFDFTRNLNLTFLPRRKVNLERVNLIAVVG